MEKAPSRDEGLQAAFEEFVLAGLDGAGDVLRRHPELLTQDADSHLQSWLQTIQDAKGRQILEAKRQLLQQCRKQGVDVALAEVSIGLKLSTAMMGALQAVQRAEAGDVEASDEEVSLLERIVQDPDFPAAAPRLRLSVLQLAGGAHYQRYQTKGQRSDLDRAIQMLRWTLDLGSEDSEELSARFGHLGVALRVRFESSGDARDLNAAVQGLQRAVAIARLTGHLSNLGVALVARYEAAGDVADLEEAMSVFREAIGQATPAERPTCLNNFGNGLLTRYRRFGTLAALNLAVESLKEAVAQTPATAAARAVRVSSLGCALMSHAERYGDIKELDEAIERLKEGVEKTPTGAPEFPGRLGGWGTALRVRFSLSGNVWDLEQATDAFRRATELTPHGSLGRPKSLTNLGTALEDRYNKSLDLPDLEEALRAYKGAVSEAPQTSTERPLYLSNLGVGFRKHHFHTGNRDDLDHAMDMFQQALELTPIDSPDRAGYLVNLGTVFEDKFGVTDQLADLSSAIAHYQQAVSHAESPNPLAMNNLGYASLRRHRVTGDANDLATGVAAFQGAIEATPADSPMLPLYFSHLGEAMLRRHSTSNDGASLDAAIENGERAWGLYERTFAALPVGHKIGQQAASAKLASWLIGAYIRRAQASGQAEQRRALELAESSKSRVLSEAIGRQSLPEPRDPPPELLARESQLLNELTYIDSTELANRGSPRQKDERLNSTERLRRRDQCRKGLFEAWQEIARYGDEAADYVALRRGDPLKFAAMIALANDFGPETAFVSLFSTGEKTFLFILRNGLDNPVVVEDQLTGGDWLEIMTRLIREVHDYGSDSSTEETWSRLLHSLLKRASQHLQGTSRIILIPESNGHLVPWTVASSRAGWRGALGSLPTIITLPTVSLLSRLRRRIFKNHAVPLVVGNPTENLNYAEQEAMAVAHILGTEPLIRSRATKRAVLERLPCASIIHLATHGCFNRSSPLESYVRLADGVLTAREILACRTPAADLLVLSACETGLVGSLGGDELAGLAQAFFHAGARSLVVSLWQVNDPATAYLMSDFYSARKSGLDKASALTQAMGQLRARPQWSHPYYWGAFVMMGDWH